MEPINLEVIVREIGADSILHHLRENGYIPGVLYGNGFSNQPIQIEESTLKIQLKEHGKSGIFHILMGNEQIPVKINEIQRDPIDQKVIHVDLQRVQMNKLISTSVPLHFFGKSMGEKNGGIVQQQIRDIEVKALPAYIPEFIQVNISDLDIGDALYVRDLMVPDGVEIQHDPDSVLLTIIPPKMIEEDLLEERPVHEPKIVDPKDGRGIDAAK
ncbi:50S ribosomal protein L25 [Tepidibacillus infernus]|uniref:Large ribosomal subunit protein bL25 n=1 Tax=Tepidibacillus decaturensis TaxID=1413211 RepID=A0A135L770_9BACI|nr:MULTISPECIES: 50S ribosomal protein L25 [Tepidibacillus]KXG44838.1 hypothetical protein U473_13030 [Tepidibacillus decaturensis]GBF11402.1 general stress protein CTC [Tepidibacillus sp. HK-1]